MTQPAPSSDEPVLRHPVAAWLNAILLAAFFIVALILFPPLQVGALSGSAPSWTKFLGRFHVVILHLPVGILALAAIMELFIVLKHKSATYLAAALTFALGVAAWGACISVVFGLLLAQGSRDLSAQFLAHQALGIATAVGVILTLVLKLLTDMKAKFAWPYRFVFALTLAALTLGAHFGGNLVHGDEYLTLHAPGWLKSSINAAEKSVLAWFEPGKRGFKHLPAKAGAAGNATFYAAVVAPLLEAKCISCHGAEKVKANLRLDSHDGILKGGENGDAVVPGEPAKSKLITSMELPMDDEEHMPPEKKSQPTKEEIALLSWWVKEGASKELKVADAKLPDELKSLVQRMVADAKGGAAGGAAPLMLALAEAATIDPAVAEAMKKINGSGASLAPVAADAKELRFTALNVAKDFTDAGLKDIEVIAANIVALDLAKTKITDAALASIAKMTALKELHLENTAVTDAGISQLKALVNLEYLNLYNTKVTDKALSDIAGLAKLKALYLWQTGVTKAAVSEFKEKHPAVVVNVGWTDADNAKVVAAAAPPPAPAPAKPGDKPAAAAKPADAPAKPAPASTAPPTTALQANALIYKDIIAPIIEAKCTSCHGKEKSKGKLRMHTLADILKGGSDGATTVVAGKPADSLMIKRAKLPLDDDDHMPPKDEKQLTKDEIAVLQWWIELGADDKLALAVAKKSPEVEVALKALGTAKPAAAVTKTPEKPKPKPLTDAEKKVVADTTAKVSALSASLMPVALDTEQLRFGCVNAAEKFGDKEIESLAPVAAQLVWVDLARSKITDAALATVAKMNALERLHLENTLVTDAGIAQLVGLTKLEYLNLYGTKVTDAGIAKLATIKSLRKLFVWKTGVTEVGAKKLEAAIPGLSVNIGLTEAQIAKLVEQTKPPEPVKPAEPAKPDPKKADPKKPAAKPVEPKKDEKKSATPPAAPPAAPAPPKPATAAKPDAVPEKK